MSVLPDFSILQNKNSLFYTKPEVKRKPEVTFKCPIGTRTDKIIDQIENDPNMEINRILIEYSPNLNLKNSEKIPETRKRIGISNYETEKLISQIDSTLEKSKNISKIDIPNVQELVFITFNPRETSLFKNFLFR